MPGHKGVRLLGIEKYDITEIRGADSLYEARGIIGDSEKNAGEIFGADTFYSTEGSSQCIRAMVYLVSLYARERGERPLILSGRNAHKAFLDAVTLCDAEVAWLCQDKEESYLSCKITPERLEKALGNLDKNPTCIYITSPDYLGNMCDISALSSVCRAHGILLLVDNAHGAYLKHLPRSAHPIDLGADMCCDSAHKTLPALTGAAYLHISKKAAGIFKSHARRALSVFGSTSPSYLILQSLDAVNGYNDTYKRELCRLVPKARSYKAALRERGYVFVGDEEIKYTIFVKKYGYTGTELAEIMRARHNIECEFADPDYIVFMLSPVNKEVRQLYKALLSVPKRNEIEAAPPTFSQREPVMSVREAMLSPSCEISVFESEGRILAAPDLACPPAVPILIPGERIDTDAISALLYYGVERVRVVHTAEPMLASRARETKSVL